MTSTGALPLDPTGDYVPRPSDQFPLHILPIPPNHRWSRKETVHPHTNIIVASLYKKPPKAPRSHTPNRYVFNNGRSGCTGVEAEYWTRDRQGAGSTLTRSTASNLEQVANLLCAQVNSASYPQWSQRDGK